MVKFSDFKECREFRHPDKAKIIKYIELLYHKDSELNGIQNLMDRKMEACKNAKLNPSAEDIQNIMDMRDESVNFLIFLYLSQFQSSNEFHQLCMDQQLLWNIQQLLAMPVTSVDEDEIMKKYEKRTDLSKKATELITKINKGISEIYTSDDKTQDVMISHVRQMMRPEERIRKREEESENAA